MEELYSATEFHITLSLSLWKCMGKNFTVILCYKCSSKNYGIRVGQIWHWLRDHTHQRSHLAWPTPEPSVRVVLCAPHREGEGRGHHEKPSKGFYLRNLVPVPLSKWGKDEVKAHLEFIGPLRILELSNYKNVISKQREAVCMYKQNKTIDGFFYFQEYRTCFEGVEGGTGDKTLEDTFFEHEVRFLFFFLYLIILFPGSFSLMLQPVA